jgi:hypothetical protein
MRGYHIRISIQPQPADTGSFVPLQIFHNLPVHKPKPTSRRNPLFNSVNKDYRLGPIRLDWVDFEVTSNIQYTAMGKEREQGRGSFFECRLSEYLSIYLSQKLYLFHTPARNLDLRTSRKGWFMCSEIWQANLRKKNLIRLLPHLPLFMTIQTERCWASWQCHHG